MTALTLDLLKNWIRVRHTDEDVILGTMLGAAVKHIEGQTGHLFTRRVSTQRLFDSGRLLFGPNPGPVTIAWTDADGDHFEPATIIAGEVSRPWAAGAVASYEAGYETADDVPEDLLVAALLLAGNWDANREATTQANVALSFGVEALIGNYRPVLV